MAYTIQDFKAFVEEGEALLPFELKLHKPVTIGSDTKEIIQFRNEPTAGDVQSLPVQKQVMGDFIRPISKCTGESENTIKKLHFKDFNAVLEIFNHFLGVSDEDGAEI